MEPTFGNGKICYIEIPAKDIDSSARFYENVFGWQVRKRGDGSTAFDDGVGQVSGTWVLGRTPASASSLMMHIMVSDMQKSCDAVTANGGEIVHRSKTGSKENLAQFRDPAGNVIGLYEHRER